MKKKLLVGLTIFMFFFKNASAGNYEKVFYDFKIESITGEIIDLNKYKNKVILIVNTASYCGFTKQYGELQELWDQYKSKGLVVFGVPSNSFNQEKKNDEDVKKFCEVNFNISFPLSSITEVKGENAHELFKWAHLNNSCAFSPLTSVILDNGKLILKLTSQNFFTSSSFFFS